MIDSCETLTKQCYQSLCCCGVTPNTSVCEKEGVGVLKEEQEGG